MDDHSLEFSVLMNRNFKVKFNRLLLGYSGLGIRIGFARANHIISKMVRTNVYCKSFKVANDVVKFYCY